MSNPPPFPPDPQQPYAQGVPQPIPYITPGVPSSYRPTSAAARTAGVVQIVLGSITTLLAFLVLAAAYMVTSSVLTPEQQAQFDQLGMELESATHVILLISGLCMAIPGIIYMILGVFVWRGASWAITSSIVLTALIVLLNLMGVANALFRGGAALEGLCPTIAMLGASAALAVLLVRASREVRQLKEQYPFPEATRPGYYSNQPYPPAAPGSALPPPPPQRPEDLPPPPVRPAE